MLKRLRIDNFKSLINVTFEPGNVNLVVGKNNSGKTNLCQAIRFLSLTARFPLQDAGLTATGEVWNLPNVYLDKDIITFECNCALEQNDTVFEYNYMLRIRVASAPYIAPIAREYAVEIEHLTVSGGKFGTDTSLLLNERGRVKLLNERRLDRHEPNPYDEIDAPTNASMVSRLYDESQNRAANLFKNYLIRWLYYDLEPIRMRGGDLKVQGPVLEPDGSNLVAVLLYLKTVDERRYRRLVDIIRTVEPKLDGINFVPPAQGALYMALTDVQDKQFSMPAISSGTLRFMAMAYVITMSARMAEANHSPAPIVVIEEPENGIYVGHLKKLMELVAPTGSYDPQFVFTSHSPYFIDLFDRYIENVCVLKSDGRNSQVIKPDPERIHEVLKTFSLGEAHFQELLG